MKKWMWVVSAVVIVAAAGGWYGQHRLKEIAADQVVSLLSQPQTKQEINDAISHMLKQGKSGSGSTFGSAGSGSQANAVSAALATVGQSIANANTTSATRGASSSGASGANSGSAQSELQGTQGGGDSSKPGASTGSAAGNPGANGESGSGANDSDVPKFTSEQQVIQYAMSHFTTQQLLYFAQAYANRGKLTTAQKDAIKQQILSQFTPQEIQAMERALGG
ncbi:hypothetical protein [Alicyclobacillus acidiphilus]|uniref:hypothetical protein n=1 Tax=Alicyclobacillus acidiphilus TaxID=182455 RepID=UPI00082B4057|nr:hypothetical protein [Alicyclobacillus acidiphilus]